MLKYVLPLLLLAATLCQGQNVKELWMKDRELHYISHKHLGTSIGIAKSLSDTLISCHVIFPNGVMYEVYPTNNIPHEKVMASGPDSVFKGCGVGFRGVGVEFSGTYELISFVEHVEDRSRSMTRQRFHLTVTLPDF